MAQPKIQTIELVDIDQLKPHPKNYRLHPQDELDHIKASLLRHGQYRSIVTARELTILAGHGVVEAAIQLKWKQLAITKLKIAADSAQALQLLAGDNEIAHLAENDDRMRTELLKHLNAHDALLGTGFDMQMLAALAMVTRPMSEMRDVNAAAEWVGMPEFEMTAPPIKIVVSFRNLEDRQAFADILNLKITAQTNSVWYPPRERDDIASIRIQAAPVAAEVQKPIKRTAAKQKQ